MINSSHLCECTCHIPFIMFWFFFCWLRERVHWTLDDILICRTFDLEMFQKCVEQLFNSFQWKTFDMLAHTHTHITLTHMNLHVNDAKFMVDVEIWCKQDLHTVIFVLLHESNWDATSVLRLLLLLSLLWLLRCPIFFFLLHFSCGSFFFDFPYHFSESYKMFHNAEII